MSWYYDKLEQRFVTFSSSMIDIGTKVFLAIFWNEENKFAANGSLDIAKQSGSCE